ncbi:MAG: hypothetical protein COB04_17945 [Gammaproteobacteria bacterium]|nr:MAG: hypothetical protein COB04_19185 [Gammaproteobacteria bacterium]PCJ12298.1 MAG: hypothetical protein COB04_17945 [Gammaproteobacteria bacterium]
MSIQLDRARKSIRELNDKYQRRTVAPVGFYSELERFGVVINGSVLVSVLPHSGSTLIGSLIDQNGDLCSYDIDYKCTELSEFQVQEKLGFRPPQHTIEKPWSKKVVAIELYNEIHS